MKKIAILLDTQIRFDGRVRRIIESLSECHTIDLFCVHSSFDDNSLFNQNVNVYHYQIDNSWTKRNLFMHRRFNDLMLQIKKQSKSYDFIYVNDYPLLAMGVQLKQHFQCTLIYDSHEIYIETINQFFPKKGWKALYGKPLIAINKFIHSRNESKLINQVHQMITVCDSLKYYFEEKLNVKNVLVVKNCPKDLTIKHNPTLLRDKLQLPISDKIILYQGDVNISRGIEKMAKAMVFIEKNIHFIIIGGGTKLEDFKHKYASNHIHFVGKVPFEELYEYTTSVDIGLTIIEPYNLSKKYALPNKVFEYMVAEIPFVTNNMPEASKIAKEENCGFIIDDSSPEKIASAINAIFKRTDLKEMGKRGRKAVEEKYNWEKEVEKLLEFIKR